MSEGIRSGVNWMRLNLRSTACGQLPDEERLGEAGDAAQQAVAAGEKRDEDLPDDALLADDHLGQFPLEACRDVGHAVQPVPGAARICPDIHRRGVYRRTSGLSGPATVVPDSQSFDTLACGSR